AYGGPCRTKFWCHAAWAVGLTGKLENAEALLQDAYHSGQRRHENYYDAELFRVRGELALLQGGSTRASRSVAIPAFPKAAAISRAQKALVLELRALQSILRLNLKYNAASVVDAAENLRKTLKRFKEGHDTPDFVEAQQLLGKAS